MPLQKIFNLEKSKAYLWLSLLGAILFAPTLFFNFTYLDDNVLILDNLNFLTNPANFFKIFSQDVFAVLHSTTAYYRPLYNLSFMLNAFIAGGAPFFYHLTNVLIHLAAINLVFVFLNKLGAKRAVAFLGALIFAVHPLVTVAVSWIPGRNDSLLMLFVLASFISLINFNNEKKWRWLGGHLLFFTLAIFTKESALVLISMIIFYLWLMAEKKFSVRNALSLAGGWAPIILIWILSRQNALAKPMSYTIGAGLKSLWVNVPATLQFLGKIFFPFNLSVLPIMQDTTYLYGLAALILLAAIIIYGLRQDKNYWRPCLFGFVWFLVFLAPSFIRSDGALPADFIEHRVYVPMLGLLFLLIKNPVWEKINFSKKYLAIFLTAIILLFSGITFFYQQNFRERLPFWQNAAKNSPRSPLARRNLGVMYYFLKNYDGALTEYQAALKLNPSEPMVHNNIGVLLMNQGRLTEAANEYLAELKINPNYDHALFNLGLVYFNQNKKTKAAVLWEQTIKINPNYWDAYRGLAMYYQSINNFERANFYAKQAPALPK